MPTGDPWCEIHGFILCNCNRFPTIKVGTTQIYCHCAFEIRDLKNKISELENKLANYIFRKIS